MKINIISLIIVCLTFAACDNLVDVKPKGFMIPEKASDLRMMLNNTSGDFANARPVTIGYDLIKFVGDHIEYSDSYELKGQYEAIYSYYTKNDRIVIDNNHGDISYMYQLVNLANVVLDILPNTTDLSEKERNQIKGEALVHRAYAFLIMVNTHAKHYDEATANQDPGIPMPLHHDMNMEIPERSTVADVYEQIITDLEEATGLLGEINPNRALPSLPGCHALLARTYLYTGKFDEALKYANLTLNDVDFLYDYNNYTEINWLTGGNSLMLPPRTFNSQETLLHKDLNYVHVQSAVRTASPEFLSLLEESDLRSCFYMDDFGNLGNYSNYPESFSGILTSEIYLIRAECYARDNQLDLALNDLNKLRQNRFEEIYFTNLESKDQDEVMNWILRERRIELAWLGLRWFDMKRLNKEEKYKKTFVRTYQGEIKTYEPNSDMWVFPFPSEIMNEMNAK